MQGATTMAPNFFVSLKLENVMALLPYVTTFQIRKLEKIFAIVR